MLQHNFVKVLLRDFVAYFVHRRHNVILGDASRIVRIKLIEDRVELVVVHEELHVERCHEEL